MIFLKQKFAHVEFDEKEFELPMYSMFEHEFHATVEEPKFESEEEKAFWVASKNLLLKLRETYPTERYSLFITSILKIADFANKPWKEEQLNGTRKDI